MGEIRYQQDVLERFIPVDLEDLLDDLTHSELLADEQRAPFRAFCDVYVALYYAQCHGKLRRLKRAYQPFNPDCDTFLNVKHGTQMPLDTFKTELITVTEKANYEQLSEQILNEALTKESPHGVDVSVDFDEFAGVFLFYRGAAVTTELHRNWKRLSFKKQPVDILIYRRLFVMLQPRTKRQYIEYLIQHKHIRPQQAEKKASVVFNALNSGKEQPVLYLKLFKDIPRADLEMLFPNTRIQIRLWDKLRLAIMGGGGAAGGIMATITKFSAAIDPLSALMAIGGLIGVLWRQVAQVFTQRTKYSALLTKNLYFYNLANNLSALSLLMDSANTEECKEAILAYFFLLVKGALTRDELDGYIERFMLQQYAIPMNFEIEDGLLKLQNAHLLLAQAPLLQAVDLNSAVTALRTQWEGVA